jgi:hypothetical protein
MVGFGGDLGSGGISGLGGAVVGSGGTQVLDTGGAAGLASGGAGGAGGVQRDAAGSPDVSSVGPDLGAAGGTGGADVRPDALSGGGGTKQDASANKDVISSTGGAATGGTGPAGGATGTGGVVGSGGVVSTGGAATGGTQGSGGTPIASLNCSKAVAPASGVVTSFSDWNSTQEIWGSTAGLWGEVFSYAGSNSSMKDAVEGTPKGLHLTGSIASADYGGGGLGFSVCSTVTAYTRVSFDVYGSAAGCSVELQLQTYDQRPTDQVPPGGCNLAGGATCWGFPLVRQIVNTSSTISTPQTIVTQLSSFSNWSAANAAQIVGMQWQFTRSGSGACTPNMTFTNIKFL